MKELEYSNGLEMSAYYDFLEGCYRIKFYIRDSTDTERGFMVKLNPRDMPIVKEGQLYSCIDMAKALEDE